MRSLAMFSGGLGALLFVVAAVGRFIGQASITLAGHSFRAGSFLLLADTFLLLGIFLLLAGNAKRG